MGAYEPRAFRFIQLVIDDWQMKLYGIAWRQELPRPKILEAAKRIAMEELRRAMPKNYGVEFVAAHDGKDACVVFMDLLVK